MIAYLYINDSTVDNSFSTKFTWCKHRFNITHSLNTKSSLVSKSNFNFYSYPHDSQKKEKKHFDVKKKKKRTVGTFLEKRTYKCVFLEKKFIEF